MSKLFVFGIGGTGSRVIRSLTMLLSSGVDLRDTQRVIPLIIDLDIKNADTNRTIKALDIYEDIRNMSYGEGAIVDKGFFSTELTKLSSLREADQLGEISESFQFDFGAIDKEFGDYINMPAMGQENQDLMELLYNNARADDPDTELRLNLSVGFKGNPNIGSVIFNNLTSSKEYKYFENSFQENDRIFIISSIFGGTGSSGFPQLMKILRSSSNTNIKRSKIGAVTVMPYFSVEDKDESAIDSQKFKSKTKAALSYYAEELDQPSALYYIYDIPGGNNYKNNEGGEDQKNDAHVVELIAASGAIHFANMSDRDLGSDTQYFEFGIRKDDPTLDMRHFFSSTQDTIARPLIRFALFSKLFNEKLPEQANADLGKFLEMSDGRLRNDKFYQLVQRFINEHFLLWLDEMKRNRRSFAPFNLKEGAKFKDMFENIELKKGMLQSDILNMADIFKKEKTMQERIPEPRERFLHCMYNWAEELEKEKITDFPLV